MLSLCQCIYFILFFYCSIIFIVVARPLGAWPRSIAIRGSTKNVILNDIKYIYDTHSPAQHTHTHSIWNQIEAYIFDMPIPGAELIVRIFSSVGTLDARLIHEHTHRNSHAHTIYVMRKSATFKDFISITLGAWWWHILVISYNMLCYARAWNTPDVAARRHTIEHAKLIRCFIYSFFFCSSLWLWSMICNVCIYMCVCLRIIFHLSLKICWWSM